MVSRNIYLMSKRLFVSLPLYVESGIISNRPNNVLVISKARYNRSAKSDFVSFKQSNVGLIVAGVGAGALFGGGYSWYKLHQTHAPIMNQVQESVPPALDKLPQISISRQVISATDNTGLKLLLFQYPTCPFCCKVRAFLDYYGFSYDVVEVDPVLRQQTSWTSYKKVPILLAQVENGFQQLNDSSMIISALSSHLHDRDNRIQELVQFYPHIKYSDEDGNVKSEIMNRYFLMFQGKIPKGRTPENIVEERKWRKWADDVLVHTLSPNVYRTRREAFQAFNWFSEVGEWDRLFPVWERFIIINVGALAMWGISKRLKKRYNLKDDVRQSLYDECNNWLRALHKNGTTFLGGSSPNLADLAVYGVLSSIEGCTAFQDLLRETKIRPWYEAMKNSVNNHKGSVYMSK